MYVTYSTILLDPRCDIIHRGNKYILLTYLSVALCTIPTIHTYIPTSLSYFPMSTYMYLYIGLHTPKKYEGMYVSAANSEREDACVPTDQGKASWIPSQADDLCLECTKT